MKTILTTLVFLAATTVAFAGVQNGESANGSPHGNVTMNSSGGIHGDYKVTFTDNAGTSATTPGTPTAGGDPGEVQDTGWVRVLDGGRYRIKDGHIQKEDENGKPVNCGPPVKEPKEGTDTNAGCDSDTEAVGTLPCYHVPVPRPTDQPKGDKPPKLEKEPLPAV